MHWLIDLILSASAAQSLLILSLVTALGLFAGSLRVFGVQLGVAGVLFSGILFAHFGFGIDPHVLEFAREFGLLIFVYTIGLQVGPGFVASLKRRGFALNLLALSIVAMNVAIVIGVHKLGKVEMPDAIGILSGATTNTPSLAASQQMLKDHAGAADETVKRPALSYAMVYPFGVLGTIFSMLLLRFILRVDIKKEADALTHSRKKSAFETLNLEITNPNLNGLSLKNIPALDEFQIVISRVLHDGRVQVAEPETILATGDVLLAVGRRENLDKLRVLVGPESKVDLQKLPSDVTARQIIVTRPNALGTTLDELALLERFGVTVTRVVRAEVEWSPLSDFRLQFGDVLMVVGEEDDIRKVAHELGDSPKQLNHPQLVPVFLGIGLGVMLGSIPIYLPGIPVPFKLGLAGGPLLVAIFLSRLGSLGPLSWYMPTPANFMLREVGISLFLACVGLKAGSGFAETLLRGDGLFWMTCGAAVTFLPELIAGLIGRLAMKLNFLTICGVLAGSMTSPPSLAFAGTYTRSDQPSVSYATVYPMVMLLRVLSVQLLLLIFS